MTKEYMIKKVCFPVRFEKILEIARDKIWSECMESNPWTCSDCEKCKDMKLPVYSGA